MLKLKLMVKNKNLFNKMFNTIHSNFSTSTNLSGTSTANLIKIPFEKLINKETNLNEEIHHALSTDGLGLLVVKNIPAYENLRSDILQKVFQLGNLDKAYLKTLERPDVNYSIGWNVGMGFTEKQYDYLQGGLLIRPFSENPPYRKDKKIDEAFRDSHQNIWPSEEKIKGFKKSLQDLCRLTLQCQLSLLPHLDKYIQKVYPNVYKENFLRENFSEYYELISRLLVYYPINRLSSDIIKEKGEKIKEKWTGWHRDFGLVTALTHPVYYNQEGKVFQNIKSALLVEDRKCRIHEVNFEENEIAMQTGDALFILSGGSIIATPHCVKVPEKFPDHLFRITIANFFEPYMNFEMLAPEGININEVFNKDPFKMANSFTKFRQGCLYQEFLQAALETFYLIK